MSAVVATAPLRIAQLGSPTGLYGAERWILALVKHLPGHLVESFACAIQDGGDREPELCRAAAEIGVRTQAFYAPGRASRPAVRQIRKFIGDNRIDILHTHGYKPDIIGALAVRGTRCKIVATPHGWSIDAGFRLSVYEGLNRLAFYFHDAVVPLSSDLHRELQRFPMLGRKLHLIENGVDLSEVDLVGEVAAEVRAHKARGAFVIGYIGQLIPRKGIDVLIRAFAAMSASNATLCIVGDGPQRGELENLAGELGVADRVEFYGYRPDRIALLKGFDVMVLPSTLEGIPRVILEAMAAGVAVVATNIPGTVRVVTDRVTGLTFEVGNVKQLTDMLHELQHDSKLRQSLSRAAGERVRTKFSAAAMAEQYLNLYQTLSGRQ